MTIFTRSIKDAVHHFGAVGDDATDNYASALLAARHMADGGYVEWPRGVYRFSDFPTLATVNGGIIGEGCGGAPYPPGLPWGTCFRHTGDGDFLKLAAGANDLVFRDLSFYPTTVKTGAEIRVGNRALQNHFQRIRALFPTRFAHVEAAVFTKFEDCHVFGPGGNAGWYVSGLPDGTLHNEDVALLGCTTYTPQAHPQSPEASTVGDWAASTAVTVGHYRKAGNYIFQYVQGGTTGATMPVPPAYGDPRERTFTQISDGSAKCVFYCRADFAGVLIDSGGDYVNIDQFCKFLQGAHAVKSVHTMPASTPPTRITISKLQVDHNYGDSLRFDAGSRIIVTRDTMIDTARGAPYRIAAGCDKFSIFPWFESCDSVPVNSAGYSAWKQAGGAINDDVLARGANGTVRFELNTGNAFWMVRGAYQWGFSAETDGKFKVAQTAPNFQIAQTWNPV